MISTEKNFVDTASDSSSSGVSWGAIFAGAAGASALSLILIILGTGLGFAASSPWANAGLSAGTLAVSSIVWITFTQIAASGIGGYLAGRLRVKWATLHTDEVYFRDTAHGLLSWAVATIVVVVLAGSVVTNIASGVGAAGATIVSAGATAAGAAAAANTGSRSASISNSVTNYLNPSDTSLGYTIESLFRKDPAANDSATTDTTANPDSTARANGEVTRIFVNALRTKALPPADQSYVAAIVAKRSGISQQDAERRVADAYNRTQAAISDAERIAKEAADKARKATAYSALWLFISLLSGAFVASLAATLGGRRRDLAIHTHAHAPLPSATVRI